MRLPSFDYLHPEGTDEALRMLEIYGNDCAILAGGTDLLPRMKHRVCHPKYLMSLKSLDALDYIKEDQSMFRIGSGTSIADLISSSVVKSRFPAFFQSLNAIGAPTIQHYRGTVGGNLCQDSRCLYYNQSSFWRSGRQPCHKAGGKTCYTVKDSDRCHATFQSDAAPVLMALNASVTLICRRHERTIPLPDLYSGFGEKPIAAEPDELLSEIQVPFPKSGSGSAYHRIAYRSAIDYPIASAAASLQVTDSKISNVRIVIGAVSRAPLLLVQPAKELEGASVADENALQHAADQSMNIAGAFAADNAGSSLEYRIQMISVMTRRALKDAVRIGWGES